jgi:hypothetical protein
VRRIIRLIFTYISNLLVTEAVYTFYGSWMFLKVLDSCYYTDAILSAGRLVVVGRRISLVFGRGTRQRTRAISRVPCHGRSLGERRANDSTPCTVRFCKVRQDTWGLDSDDINKCPGVYCTLLTTGQTNSEGRLDSGVDGQ